ncbi:hypothetical protein HK102_012126 [Quaeritorhiza haematococci]|nr:hypothetical protein HK102_012126 [Quaeritorhiza haematococci]
MIHVVRSTWTQPFWIIAAVILPLHVYWFYKWARGQLRKRAKLQKESDNKPAVTVSGVVEGKTASESPAMNFSIKKREVVRQMRTGLGIRGLTTATMPCGMEEPRKRIQRVVQH